MPNLKELLKGKLTARQLSLIRRGYDIVGDIAIVEIPRELEKKKEVIAAAVMSIHHNVSAVYMEKGGRSGKLRLQKLEWLAGEKRTETTATENGVKLKLDVAKVYFSPRMASERKRIYRQVKSKENVLVMFSGAAPYVIEIAKHTEAKVVYGIEVNRAAHRYAAANAKINKVDKKVKLCCGDVKKVLPRFVMKFDRVIMPLPKGAHWYLQLALKHVKKGGMIHYYDFLPEEEIPETAVARVAVAANKQKKKVKILKVAKCGQLAPRAYRVCVDAKIM